MSGAQTWGGLTAATQLRDARAVAASIHAVSPLLSSFTAAIVNLCATEREMTCSEQNNSRLQIFRAQPRVTCILTPSPSPSSSCAACRLPTPPLLAKPGRALTAVASAAAAATGEQRSRCSPCCCRPSLVTHLSWRVRIPGTPPAPHQPTAQAPPALPASSFRVARSRCRMLTPHASGTAERLRGGSSESE